MGRVNRRMKNYSFTQETIIAHLMNLPAEVATAGQEVIDARFTVDEINLEINEEMDMLKTLEAALYNQYKSGELHLQVAGRITEQAIHNSIAMDDTVISAKEHIRKKRHILLLAKKVLAEKELVSNVLTFTKAQSMKSVHSQLLKEFMSENLVARLDSIDEYIQTIDEKVDKITLRKSIASKKE